MVPSPRFYKTTAIVSSLMIGGLGMVNAIPQQPNVLFIFADDMRADAGSAFGNANFPTPNLEKLSQRGCNFSSAYIMGGTSAAVCAPSRAMLMTGRSLFRAPINLGEFKTWQQTLLENGYTTFGTGKWHNNIPGFQRSFSEGKSVFFGGMTNNQFAADVQDMSPTDKEISPKRKLGSHTSEGFADAAIDFLKSQKDSAKPFACYLAFTAPHDPRQAPPEYHKQADANKPPAPPNFQPYLPFNNGEMVVRDEKLAPWPRTKEIIRQNLADYQAAIVHMDAQIGRVLKTLQETGKADNTIIIFSADNGLSIGSHGLMGKQNLYEESLRVPLIIAGPGIPGGKKSDAKLYLFDLFPTICELTSIAIPGTVEGKSLVPVLKGKTNTHRDGIFGAYRHLQRSFNDGKWKLIVYPPINKTELFDLVNDPYETRDVSSTSPERVKEMLKEIEIRQKEYGDKANLTVKNPKQEAWTPPASQKKK
ncbi:MAG: sulfatase-like hydrolase/transferase [Puniceicoccales bacterium]|nr:sulfatase-like hydrolase/transferase [Puniceicoccales bacterium]